MTGRQASFMFWPRIAKGASASGSTHWHGRAHASLIGPECHTRGCDIRDPKQGKNGHDRSTDPQAPSAPEIRGRRELRQCREKEVRRDKARHAVHPVKPQSRSIHAARHFGALSSAVPSLVLGREDRSQARAAAYAGCFFHGQHVRARHTRLLADSDSTDSTSPLVFGTTSAMIPSYGLILAIRSTTLRFRRPPHGDGVAAAAGPLIRRRAELCCEATGAMVTPAETCALQCSNLSRSWSVQIHSMARGHLGIIGPTHQLVPYHSM
jgi:hypothetical protein